MAFVDIQTAPMRGGRQSALRDWVRALESTAAIAGKPHRTLFGVIEELAEAHGDRLALISANESLTYRSLTQRASRYARWALDQNLAKGDTVALIMPNRPEYMAVWLGISSIGGVVALINTHLRGPSLTHCIDAVRPKHVIVGSEMIEAFYSTAAAVSTNATIWSLGGGNERFSCVELDVERFSAAALTKEERRAVTISDRALHIYTSGTTGLPKAANISHNRLLQWSFWFAGLMNTGPDDRMYDCLPMYHSVGGTVATGALLVRGGSVFIRDKFSACEFWKEIRAWDCTLFQYIGELCRYLLHAEQNSDERAHRLRLCCGNGLRADIWQKFQQRFEIPRIIEFYAATEGNISLCNVEGKIGAIGRIPSFLSHRFPLALVKFDVSKECPARGANGLCVGCGIGEIGEAIGRIRSNSAESGREFEGYTSEQETERKIIRDVFERGDAWFRTGDLMRRDGNGFYYFVDRIGDTFRWKGENVAASEVAEVIAAFPGIKEAVVYGVHVDGTDGSAGMAALVVDGPLDFSELREHLICRLPDYARPVFLRIKHRIELTGTLKYNKVELISAGFDPIKIADAIYFADPSQHRSFVQLDQELYCRIQAGELRL